jgi:type IV pilus assembly protein PilB
MRGKKKAVPSLEERLRAVRELEQPRPASLNEPDDPAPQPAVGAAAEVGGAAVSFIASATPSAVVTMSPVDSFADWPAPTIRELFAEPAAPVLALADPAPLLWAASEGDTLLASGAVESVAGRRIGEASPLVAEASIQVEPRHAAFEIPDLGPDVGFAEPVVVEAVDPTALEAELGPFLAEFSAAAAESLPVATEPAPSEAETGPVEPERRGFEYEPVRTEVSAPTNAERLDDGTRSRRLVRMSGLGRRRAVETDGPRAEPTAAFSTLAEPQSGSEHTETPAPADDVPWTHQADRGGRFGRIGTTMIERGLITNEQLDEALEVQRSTGRRVGEILVGMGALSRFELARVLADHMGVPFVDLRAKPPDVILGALLPEEVARRYRSLVIDRWNDQLVIAMANPADLFALDDLQMVMRQPIITAMAVEEDLLAAIDRVYRVSDVETTLDAATSDYVSAHNDALLGAVEVDEGPVVRLVNALLEQAIRDRASDLHVEPSSTRIAVRFRVDGVLHDSSEVPLTLLRPLVSRLKILSNLDIAQNRVAQDGRFTVTVQGRPVDVRVVTVPTAAGESVILRLLDPTRDALDISSLGLNAAEQARFVPPFFASQGAAFIVGPTGSGKTSTVYTLLSEINTRSKSIISVEDPVEYRLDGIKQIQANPRVGVTFANTLPSILRSDPDIVFIGEVRDAETARIAADASITGHLVLSTLHATRSAAAPMRLIEMGVEPYLVASALTLVAAQRLARKLCERCTQPVEGTELEDLRDLGADDAILDGATVRRAVGCPACRNTGYLGRLPIFEIMPVTEPLSRLILDRAPRAQIERLAVEEGMETMRTAALRRVAAGVLSVEEMMRIIS